MQLIAPPGYGAVAPFDKEKHAGLGFSFDSHYTFASRLNAIYITSAEFVQSSRDYPIVFSYNEEQHSYIPMIVTSLNSGDNQFVSKSGQWASNTYIPAYIRRYPFCIVEIPDDNGTTKPLVCVDEPALNSDAQPFFNKDSNPTEAWTRVETFMNEYETARQLTSAFTNILAEHNLFEVFEAQAFDESGKRYHMTDMYRINEKKLQCLTGGVLSEFVEKKYMYFIYAHLISLDNFQHLLDRTVTH